MLLSFYNKRITIPYWKGLVQHYETQKFHVPFKNFENGWTLAAQLAWPPANETVRPCSTPGESMPPRHLVFSRISFAFNEQLSLPTSGLTFTFFFVLFFGALGFLRVIQMKKTPSYIVFKGWHPPPLQYRAGIFKQSMGARNQIGIGLSYRPARLHRLAELIPWNRFLGSTNV